MLNDYFSAFSPLACLCLEPAWRAYTASHSNAAGGGKRSFGLCCVCPARFSYQVCSRQFFVMLVSFIYLYGYCDCKDKYGG